MPWPKPPTWPKPPRLAKTTRALIDAAVSRIVDGAGWASVRAGIGLGSSRLRSSKCSDGQPNAGSQQDRFGREFAAGHRSLLWGFAPQFKLIPKWESGGPAAMARMALLTFFNVQGETGRAPECPFRLMPGAALRVPGKINVANVRS